MEKIVLIAVEKDENNTMTLVFFNPNNKTITYTDLNNDQRTVKVDQAIAKKYKHILQYNQKRKSKRIKCLNKLIDTICFIYFLGLGVIVGANLIKGGIKYYKIEYSTEEEKEAYITRSFLKIIDENESYTPAQKIFLKENIEEYVEITGVYYDYFSFYRAEDTLEKTYINYQDANIDKLGDANPPTGEINLYLRDNSWPWSAFLHEHLHQVIGKDFSYMEEYLVYAITYKLIGVDGYITNISNTNLFLLSEIIGKEEVMLAFVNGDEDTLPKTIVETTGVSETYATSIVDKMNEIMFCISENYDTENLELRQETLTRELVQLAALAKGIDYEDDFVLSALYSQEYYVDNFFMDDAIVLKDSKGVEIHVQRGLEENDLFHIEARSIMRKLYADYKAGTISEHNKLVFNEILTLCDDSFLTIAKERYSDNLYRTEDEYIDLVMSYIATEYFPINIADADRFICELYYTNDYDYNAQRVYTMLFGKKYKSKFTKEDVADVRKINDDVLSIEGMRKNLKNDMSVLNAAEDSSVSLYEAICCLREGYPEEFVLLESSNLQWEYKDVLEPRNSKLIDEENVYIQENVFPITLGSNTKCTYFMNPFSDYEHAKVLFSVNGEQKQSASRQTMEVEGSLLEDVFIVDIDDINAPNTYKTSYSDIGSSAIVTVPYEEYRQKQNNATLAKTIDNK